MTAAKKIATYADVLAAPSHLVAEIVAVRVRRALVGGERSHQILCLRQATERVSARTAL